VNKSERASQSFGCWCCEVWGSRVNDKQRVPAEWLRERKERQPTFSFSKVLGAVLLSRLSLLWFSGYNISTEIL